MGDPGPLTLPTIPEALAPGGLARALALAFAAAMQWGERVRRAIASSRFEFVGTYSAPIRAARDVLRWQAIVYSTSVAGFTLSVPAPSMATRGAEILLIRASADTNTLTVSAPGSYLQGSATATIATAWSTLRLVDIGDAWDIGVML